MAVKYRLIKRRNAINESTILDIVKASGEIKEEALNKISEIIDRGAYIGGAEVNAFEKEFADYCSADACAGVESGTGALRLILKAMDIGPDDEVIVPANTFAATAEAVCHVGAKPVFVDVNPTTLTLTVETAAKAIGKKTKAIIPVHLYGHPADMDPIMDLAKTNNIKVIEDAAQAHGARYKNTRVGSLGDAAAFSFYPGKNLGAFGDAGAVVSNNSGLVEKIKILCEHGQPEKYIHKLVGETARLDALQAAVLRLKLKTLDKKNAQRRDLANRYIECLKSESGWLKLPIVSEDVEPVWHLFVVHCDNREALMQHLQKAEIGCGMHYPMSLHKQEAFFGVGKQIGDLKNSQQSAQALLSLPIFPEMTYEQQDYVVDVIKRFAA